MIKVDSKGRWKNTRIFLANDHNTYIDSVLHKYGKIGVDRLRAATPVDTGLTASCWNYVIETENKRKRIVWTNSNVNKGVKIAIILQMGHATKDGSWVEGVDYINPALQQVFKDLSDEAWKEVNK